MTLRQAQKQATPEETADLRRERRESFLRGLGWKNVQQLPLAADASFRRYYRLRGEELSGRPLMLLEDPTDRPPIPPLVMVEPYIKIAAHLRALGLHAPEVYHRNIPHGLLVIEDFGDDTYTRLLNRGADPLPLYDLAVDALLQLHKDARRAEIDLPPYDDRPLLDEAMLLLDWYYPALTGQTPAAEMKESFAAVWRGLFRQLPQDQKTLVLRDYHVDNLMLVPGASRPEFISGACAPGVTGIWACGLLDFQDALIGQFSYDLMSLLEDARRDVPEELQKHLYNRYMAGMGRGLDRAAYDYSYKVLAAQRHAKILGIFVRLSVRDGKSQYLQFIPRVRRLFLNALRAPALLPLRQWFEQHHIDMERPLP